ncbi:hypothetical protein, partial [Bradyrhizobium sp. CCBAU 21360]|uniref:hypothetical protein n=1 Tax=Bradyrhizobium sp. CCBAU 21360 TaxID=1325081 RepID=UPI00230553C5
SRASTSNLVPGNTWMAGTSPAMTVFPGIPAAQKILAFPCHFRIFRVKARQFVAPAPLEACCERCHGPRCGPLTFAKTRT